MGSVLIRITKTLTERRLNGHDLLLKNMNIEHYKTRMEGELQAITENLKGVGRINPDNPLDWEAVPENMDIDTADTNIVADKFEEFENNKAILTQLEVRFNELSKALAKIKEGKYGTCEICGKEIEPERLEANAAARTCLEHVDAQSE